MITFTRHDSATCPDCGVALMYCVKDEGSGWKVYYECSDRCGWERMAGRVKLVDIEHRDEVDDRACEMGEQWAEP